ncbi:zf-4CXXC_R1 domain-containing protein [Cephalotus follicularis]|uniref:Zf-4CXXC_R1 domain-containing protein n=1 Tax=Cephalotus follicularis TaxID=3775 RepID=A0A1Q3DCK7_CEPFO|nr:zf-4CXXC_R1 domain-containing protein [Cephalotus follicularis]
MASPYEQIREARIKENMAKIQQLGLKDVSFKLKSLAATVPRNMGKPKKFSSSPCKPTPLQSPGSLRRSSRLQNSTPVCYSEVVLAKKDEWLGEEGVRLEEGSKPEVYTQEHAKMLGNTERSWTLFVDGYGNDGRRIYDQINGKTCHQCRQKTLGYRTSCIKCNLVQGQFCGDCLYMRYGEHVLEAIENSNWTCPACRGICNCSICRAAKGWAPTGSLYRQISKMGFKSVAHYLIQTKREKTHSEKDPDIINEVPAKRSLSFQYMEEASQESPQIDDSNVRSLKPQIEENGNEDYKSEKENKIQASPNAVADNQFSAKRSLLFSNIEAQSNVIKSAEVDFGGNPNIELSNPQLEDKEDIEIKCEKEKEFHIMNEGNIDSNVEFTKLKLEVHAHLGLSKPQIEWKKDAECKCETVKVDFEVHSRLPSAKPQIEDNDIELKREKEKELHILKKEEDIHRDINMETAKVNIGVYEQLGLTKRQFEDKRDEEFQKEQINSSVILESFQKLQKKRALAIEPSLESVAGRLRQKGRTGNGSYDKLTMVNETNSDVEAIDDIGKEKEMLSAETKHGDSNIVLNKNPKLKKKPVLAAEPSTDSVAGRLKRRRDNITRRD